jgi:hypothetical protein
MAIAHFGLLMTALPRRHVGLALGWAIAWMFILDIAKTATYHVLGRHEAVVRTARSEV